MGISREEALCVYVLAGLLIVGSAVLMWNHRAARWFPNGGIQPGFTSALPASGGSAPPVSSSSGAGFSPPGLQAASPAASVVEPLVVHVSGSVKTPGVYRLSKGDRVDDAINAAGGPGPDAVVDALNLASRLEDGQKVHVPSRKDLQQGDSGADGGSGWTGGVTWGSSPKVNLNTATREQLDSLPGIGPGLATAIIEYRQRTGGFKTPEDLMKVGGIGQKTFARLKPLVAVH